MDEFTQALATLAYKTIQARRRDRRPITTEELAQQIESHWATYCEGTIARWSADIMARAPHQQLADFADQAWYLLAEIGENWEYPGDDDDLEIWAGFSAWALACLRWHRRELAGRAQAPDYTPADLAAWLAHRQLHQLSFF